MIAAQLAIIAAFLASYPLETVVRRLEYEATKPKEEQIYDGIIDCFKKILENEGIGGFFKGALMALITSTTYAMVSVVKDEILDYIFRKHNEEDKVV